jgi:phage/plasmid-associated DNA primase
MIELPDVSGSLAGKMIPLHFRNTWIDRQDASLSDKLQRELPGILNRLVAALCRLRVEGHFSIPESSKEVLHHFEIQNNAVEVFLKETFVQDPKGFVPNELLDSERQKWELYHNVVIQDPQTGKRVHSNRLAQHIRRYASWSIGASRTSAARGLTGIRMRSTLGDPPDGASLV